MGLYRGTIFNAVTGGPIELPLVRGRSWTSPMLASGSDWAILLEKKREDLNPDGRVRS